MANNSRNYILDRITSKKTSIEEFNYDALQAPPISMFLSYDDIAQLRYIATSIKLSSKANERYKLIDRIMKNRGMMKVGAGTNRVIYAHPDYPDIVFKIAADDVGMQDNPAEFRNQFIIKPFCAKTFEVTPCGTVACSERVIPITSREEYLSVVSNIYELINEWLIGEFVLADFGSRYFMNVGMRKSFGVVLLDYTYIYKLDGNKLFCNKPDPLSPSGKCDGVIDYDSGYNELICTKCGAKYKAKELEKKILDKELIVEKEGEIDMEFTRRGGSLNLNNTVQTNKPSEVLGEAKSYIPRPEKKEEVPVRRPARRSVDFSSVAIGDNVEKPKMEAVRTTAVEEPVVPETKTVEVEHLEVKQDALVVNGVSTETVEVVKDETPKRTMVTFSEDIKKEALEAVANKEEEEKTPVRIIEDAVKDIVKALGALDIDLVKKTEASLAITNILNALRKEDSDFVLAEQLEERLPKMNSEALQDILNLIAGIVNVSVKSTNTVKEGNDIIIDYAVSIEAEVAEEDATVVADNIFEGSFFALGLAEDSTPAYPVEEEAKEEVEESTKEESKPTSNAYKSMRMYDAKIVNIKELFPKEQPNNAIVIYDENGNMLAIDNEIIAIDTINGKNMNNVTVVSKAWYDGLNEDDDVTDVDSALKVAGMSVEEFISAEEAVKED